jgi:hypothetical protein
VDPQHCLISCVAKGMDIRASNKIFEQSEFSVTMFAWLYGQLMEFLQLKDSVHTYLLTHSMEQSPS